MHQTFIKDDFIYNLIHISLIYDVDNNLTHTLKDVIKIKQDYQIKQLLHDPLEDRSSLLNKGDP